MARLPEVTSFSVPSGHFGGHALFTTRRHFFPDSGNGDTGALLQDSAVVDANIAYPGQKNQTLATILWAEPRAIRAANFRSNGRFRRRDFSSAGLDRTAIGCPRSVTRTGVRPPPARRTR